MDEYTRGWLDGGAAAQYLTEDEIPNPGISDDVSGEYQRGWWDGLNGFDPSPFRRKKEPEWVTELFAAAEKSSPEK